MGSIAIYIGRHLCTAPRPAKEADALAAAGHDVTVHGLWSDPRLIARDQLLTAARHWRFEPYADCRSDRFAGRCRWWLVRAQNRLARRSFERSRRIKPALFGYGTRQLNTHAERNPADLLIFHSEGGLWAADRLHRAGRRVGMDFEDWFSRDLPVAERANRPVDDLMRLESAALRFGPYVLATSHAMAAALAEAYRGPVPTVIYNTFPRIAPPPLQRASRTDTGLSLHWFSQTLGPARGLETLFAALPAVTGNWSLHLLADDPSGYGATLLRRLPEQLRSRVHLEPTVPNADLPARIAQHDVGLALDLRDIPSRNLTITNKIFQYLQGGLAVVASDTAGHCEVLTRAPAAGTLYRADDASALARALSSYGIDRDLLARAQLAAREAAESVFAHEREVPVYGELAERALISH